MTDEGNDRDRLINVAIDESIKFEERMDETDFDSWLDGVCLCSWNKIPGEDSKILRKFLKDKIFIENFEIEWVETAEIEEIEDGKAIEVVTKKKSLLLRLNDEKDEKTKFELKIDDGKVRAYEFTVETKGDKLNIYFTDSSETLKELGQFDGPFKNYETNRNELRWICDQMKLKGDDKSPNSGDKSSLERKIISKLFDSKLRRLDARICSNKNDEQEKYKEALHYLLFALNEHDEFCLQMKQNGSNKSPTQEEDNALDMWLILIYNDLSICYAGLENSSMSMGYAEEARGIIEKEKSYKEFEKKWSASNSKNRKDIEGLDFVSSKLFKLYTIALFNQAEAERRSHQYTEAERNFKKIKKYGEENTCLINFNHYSAILYLSLLYIDQGRGKEAIGLLEKVINNSNEADIRYWKAFIAKSQALIDQSEYDEAKGLLFNKFLERESTLRVQINCS